MNRAKRIAKTILLVLVRIIELVVRTYVFLIHPIISVILALILAAFTKARTGNSYEDCVNEWCHCLVIGLIDWYDEKWEWVEKKLNCVDIEDDDC